MATLIAFAVALFIIASFAVRWYHQKEVATARQWFVKGQAALAGGQPARAIDDFRNALAYSPQFAYRLQLAQALIAAGRHQEARAHLLSLLEQEPGNGQVSLELARLAVERGDIAEAEKYYHNAIYGVWDVPDPVAARRDVRFELSGFLLAQHKINAARAELTALGANLPEDTSLHIRVAQMFASAGDLNSALREYENALGIDPDSLPALLGAGEAAFQISHYVTARGYLRRASRLDPNNTTAAAQQLAKTEMVLRMDPFAPRLSIAERARRTLEAFKTAMNRLSTCASSTPAASTAALSELSAQGQTFRSTKLKSLLRHPDSMYPIMDWVASAEQATTQACGQPTGADLALSLIAKQARPAL